MKNILQYLGIYFMSPGIHFYLWKYTLCLQEYNVSENKIITLN